MTNHVRGISLFITAATLAVTAASLFRVQVSHADDQVSSPTLQSEGVSGDIDKQRRGPLLSVSTHYYPATSSETAHTKILADATVQHDQYKKYPIRFDFYVNRSLVTSQIRSTELPGPIGVDIDSKIATVPFNYSVIATLVHPNRQFMTLIQGAVYGTEISGSLSCNLTITDASTENSTAKVYVAESVQATQTGNNAFTLSFESSKLESGEGADTVKLDASLSSSGNTASGSITSTLNEQATVKAVTGDIEVTDGAVKSLSVTSADGLTKLDCSE